MAGQAAAGTWRRAAPGSGGGDVGAAAVPAFAHGHAVARRGERGTRPRSAAFHRDAYFKRENLPKFELCSEKSKYKKCGPHFKV